MSKDFKVKNGLEVTTNITASGNISASGVGTFASLDISGNIDIDGTTNLDNTDIDGTFAMDGSTFDVSATGLVTIDSVGLSIDNAGTATNITSTADAAGEDFTIALAGATNSSLILSSTGTAADALQIKTTAGGIDITTTGAAAGEDIDISTNASVNVTSTEDAANAIYLRANAGTSETIKIHADQGTGAGSIELTSDAGSIDINSADNVTIDAADEIIVTTTSADGHIALVSAHTAGQAVHIDANANAGSILDIDAGILDIDVDDAITIDAADEIVVTTTSADGHISLVSAHTAGQAIHLDGDANAGSIVDIDAGILDIDVTGATSIDAGGALNITTTGAASDISVVTAHTAGVALHIDANANAGSIVDIDAGILDIDVTGAATLDAAGVAIGAGSSELDLTTTGTLDINANALDMDLTDSSAITLTSSEAAEDLTIEQVGGNDSSILILAAGTGTDAIKIDATAGDMLIAPSLANGKTLKLGPTSATEMVFTPSGTAGNEKISLINTSGTADDAIIIETKAGGLLLAAGNDSLHLDANGTDADALNIDSAGGIDVDAADEIVITTTSADGHISLVSAHTAGQAVHIDANANAGSILDIDAGILDLDTDGKLEIDSVGAASHILHTATANGDFTIGMDGAADASLILSSTGTAADALQIKTTAGGMDITVDGAAAGEDLDITADSSINITATEDAANAIYLRANAGTSETIKIHSDQGTSVSEGAASVSLLSDAGGVELRSTADLANAINITNDGGTSGTITIFNDQGTAVGPTAASIQLLTDAGGIGISSTANLEGAIQIETDGGANETISIHSDQGTGVNAATGTTDASINLISDAGGIGINSGINGANAIRLEANGGANETIVIHSNQGTGAGSIQLLSDVGGITLTGDTDHGVLVGTVSGGPISIGHTTSETTVNDNLSVTGDLFAADKVGIDGAGIGSGKSLTVAGDISASGDLYINQSTNGISTFGGGAVPSGSKILIEAGTKASASLHLKSSNQNWELAVSKTAVGFAAAGALVFRYNGAVKHVFDSSGNLNVDNDISASGNLYLEDQNALIFAARGHVSASATLNLYGDEIDLEAKTDTDVNIKQGGNIYVKFDGSTERVGIGKLAPTKPLEVAGDISASGRIYTDTDVVVGDDVFVGDDLSLTSDSSVLKMGAGNDITFTHDGTTGLTIAATPISIDSTGELHLNSTTGDIKFQDGGTDQLGLDMDGTGGEIIAKLLVDADDLVFQQYDGTEALRIGDDATISATKNKFAITGNTDGTHQGDVVFFGGTTSMTVGTIYHYKSDGTWEAADADAVATSDGLLAVALGAASDTNGMLLRGMVTLDHDPGAVGDVLYLSTTAGDATATAPSGNNDIVRVIGYCLHASNGQIWFNPDNTFVEVSA